MPGATGFGCGSRHASSRSRARVSGQSIAARSARPSAALGTTPCICPEKPIPRTASRSLAGRRDAASTSAAYHASTVVSAQPGCALVTA
ncbi:hypothetical protein AWB82_00560 [Caballeronia glebae]|uniref:Uncharacterized protein n=1 Tax=Caballeronia glebae TaxID=1777143 RepID=A0A157ZD13_9BURK|nr:hypothetical protein AWB82_00560 [Caballeronia glebae]